MPGLGRTKPTPCNPGNTLSQRANLSAWKPVFAPESDTLCGSTPEEFEAMIRRELVEIGKVFKAIGFKPQ